MPVNKDALSRYLVIDACLRNKQKPYPKMEDLQYELRNKIGTIFSISTIQKDIKTLKESTELGYFAPIKFSKSFNGYHYSDPNFTITKLPLNQEEIDALKKAHELLKAFNGKQLTESYNQAFIKLMAAVNEKTEINEYGLPFVFSEQPPLQWGFERFNEILDAIKLKKPIKFEHFNIHTMDITNPTLHPYQLIEFNHFWYVIGLSEEKKQIRVYGLDRIVSNIQHAKIPFNGSKTEAVKKFNTDMYGVFALTGEKKQVIKFTCSDLFSFFVETHPIHHSQKMHKNKDGKIECYSINVIPTYELIRWFFANSTDVVVHNATINIIIKDMLKQALKEK